MDKSMSFLNLSQNCISPMGFSSFKSEEREERPFNPCVIQHLGESLNALLLSPSKMLNLNSPLPLASGEGKTISKRLFFNFN